MSQEILELLHSTTTKLASQLSSTRAPATFESLGSHQEPTPVINNIHQGVTLITNPFLIELIQHFSLFPIGISHHFPLETNIQHTSKFQW